MRHLNRKNSFSIIIGVCVFGLALVPLKVAPEQLSWLRYQVLIYALGAVGIGAIFAQSLMQSKEDKEHEEREKTRDATQVSILQRLEAFAHENVSPEVIEEAIDNSQPKKLPSTAQEIDGELFRLATSPRTMVWEILRDAYKLQGLEPKVDCDFLLEMYLVNASPQDKYVRELRLSAEVNGVRATFDMQSDVKAEDFNHKKWEYAIEGEDFYEAETPLKLLLPNTPFRLAPQQPSEGWIRFLGKDVNPDKINGNSWQVMVVDSVGTEYPITKVSTRPAKGKIGLRRVS